VYRILFLDAGGVLVLPNWQRIAPLLARRGVSITAEALAAVEPQVRRELDEPHLIAQGDAARLRAYYARVLELCGVQLGEAELKTVFADVRREHARSNLWDDVPVGVPAALARLKEGRTLVVLSNSNGTVAETLQRLNLASFFDAIVDSGREGIEKPNPAIFQIALDRVGARAEDVLHVGDTYHVDVTGARAVGIAAWLVDAAGLYPHADCPRVRSLVDLADALGPAPGSDPDPVGERQRG
jgi:putative hydrolase of the HAD superfamily